MNKILALMILTMAAATSHAETEPHKRKEYFDGSGNKIESKKSEGFNWYVIPQPA